MRMIAKLRHVGVVMVLLTCAALAGCGKQIATAQLSAGILPPVMNPVTEVNRSLRDLPPPSSKVAVAVYNYADQTGQFKHSETTQTLSKAVTQGSTSILIKALQDVGDGSWFTVVERERIDNLLKERSIIAQMRMVYLGEKQLNPKALPPLLFAGILFEGGIIGFDSNLQTGGLGARLLGIGGDVKYRLDTITVYLRAVSTKTGQVVASVTTHKTIASVGVQGGVFKFIALDTILEAEAGFTKNEPEQLAVQQAIEKAVYAMVIEGSRENVWSFADKTAQSNLINDYHHQDLAVAGIPRNISHADATASVKSAGDKVKTASAGSAASSAAAPTVSAPKQAGASQTAPSSAARELPSARKKPKPDKAAAASPLSPWQTSVTARPSEEPPAEMRSRFGHRPTSH